MYGCNSSIKWNPTAYIPVENSETMVERVEQVAAQLSQVKHFVYLDRPSFMAEDIAFFNGERLCCFYRQCALQPKLSGQCAAYLAMQSRSFRWHGLVNHSFCMGFANVCDVALHNKQGAVLHLYMSMVYSMETGKESLVECILNPVLLPSCIDTLHL